MLRGSLAWPSKTLSGRSLLQEPALKDLFGVTLLHPDASVKRKGVQAGQKDPPPPLQAKLLIHKHSQSLPGSLSETELHSCGFPSATAAGQLQLQAGSPPSTFHCQAAKKTAGQSVPPPPAPPGHAPLFNNSSIQCLGQV